MPPAQLLEAVVELSVIVEFVTFKTPELMIPPPKLCIIVESIIVDGLVGLPELFQIPAPLLLAMVQSVIASGVMVETKTPATLLLPTFSEMVEFDIVNDEVLPPQATPAPYILAE